MTQDQEKISRIKNSLRFHSKGLSITEVARQLHMNRNSVAKYLEILHISGQADVKTHGMSKIYSLSQRVPISAMIGFSSDMILMVDDHHRILQVNDRLLRFAGISREDILGKEIETCGLSFLNNLPIDAAVKGTSEENKIIPEKRIENRGQIFFFAF